MQEAADTGERPVTPETTEAYFTVGALKFTLMSIFTFNIYSLYWFYRNWRVVRNREGSGISPFWRTSFAPIWIFALGTRFKREAQARQIRLSLPVLGLGVMYLVMNVLWALPGPYLLVSNLGFLPLLPFDFAARRLDGNGELAIPICGRFSGWNIAGIILGALLMLILMTISNLC